MPYRSLTRIDLIIIDREFELREELSNTNMSTDYESFAYEIASTLRDKESLPLFQDFVRTYHEEFLRKILLRVMSIPDNKIRRTRGALFTFLVRQNGFSARKDSRD